MSVHRADRRTRLSWALLACAVFATARAGAQGKPSPQDSTTREARTLYDEALRHYNVAEYDAAIEKFKRAYVLTSAPELLFNIAQAHRLKGPGSCAAALQFYESYLRVQPQSARRASVESAIADMRTCVAKEEPPPTPPAPKEAPPPAASPSPPPSRPAKAGTSWVPIAVGAAGLAVAATGGAFLVWSKLRYDTLQTRGCAPSCDPSEVDGPRTAQAAGDVLLISGAAIVLGGVVVWLIGHERTSASSAWLTPSGRGLVTGVRF